MTDKYLEDNILVDDVTRLASQSKVPLYERVGGRPVLERVHRIFYDKLYAHPWLGGFFNGIDQKKIENQQSDFIAQLIGGPKMYGGRLPHHAHAHIFITEELFNVRSGLLRDSLMEAHVPEKEREEWLLIDRSFKRAIVKQSPDTCVKRFVDEDIVVIEKPLAYSASS
jgi:hemoglobin